MTFTMFLRNPLLAGHPSRVKNKRRASRPRGASSRYRPRLEALEDRVLLDTALSVDANAARHAIDPRIYGVNLADQQTVADLNVPLNRQGGNTTSRYNWQQNASNHAQDFYWESLADGPATTAGLTDGFIAATKAAGADASVTIPMVGWVAKLGANRASTWSFSVNKYGAQQKTDPDTPNPDAGNGVRPDGTTLVAGNNPNDANVPSDTAFQRGWIQHMVSTFGTAGNGGLRFYTLDNEPGIWHETHRDVHPNGATMDEVKNDLINYATMIKQVDPNAQTLGPEEFGWSGYFYSGRDLQFFSNGGVPPLPDRSSHGNMDYIPYLLDQLRQQNAASGQRLLDVLTVHYYPQGEEDHATQTTVRDEFTNDVTSQTQLLRNRSTRSLWDPNYVDASYIGRIGPNNGIVRLIPLLRDWVNQFYPGTGIGITEYNWGAPNHMNGATAEADVLGIFGREQGLSLANYFPLNSSIPIPPMSPVSNAFKIYRNYDGQHSVFGDTSVATTVPNPDAVSAFSAIRSSDGALTVMVDNKNLVDPANPNATETITVQVSNFQSGGVAERWQLAATNPNDLTTSAITHLGDVQVNGSTFTVTVPMQSVTLFVLRPSSTPTYNLKSNGDLFYVPAGGSPQQIDSGVQSIAFRANGPLYDLERNGKLFTFQPQTSFQQIDSIVETITIGPDGTLYDLERNGNLFSYRPETSFHQIDSIVQSIAMGADGTLYDLARNGNLFAFQPGTSFRQIDSIVQSITMGTDGTLYDLARNGNLFTYQPGTSFRQIDSVVQTVTLSTDGTLYDLARNGNLFSYRPETSFHQIDSIVQNIAMGTDGTLYDLASNGNLFAYRPETSFHIIDSGVSSIAVGLDGILYDQERNGNLYAYTPETSYRQIDSGVRAIAMRNDGVLFNLELNGNLFTLRPETSWEEIDQLVLAISLSADGNTVYARLSNGTIRAFSA